MILRQAQDERVFPNVVIEDEGQAQGERGG
jgi:hypothetical protein